MVTYPTAPSLLEDPDLSRQWVLRRMQRALTLDLAAAALQLGIATTARSDNRSTAQRLGEGAQGRAEVTSRLITRLGSAPYSSVGLARAFSRAGGYVLGIIGAWAWQPLMRQLATHTLSEYDLLLSFVDGALGIEIDLTGDIEPLLRSAENGLALVS